MNHPVNHHSKKTVSYRTYLLVETSTKYNRTVSNCIAKMAKRMTVQMKPHTFNPLNSISTIGFVNSFKLACDASGAHEGAAMWLFYFFMNKTSSAVLNAGFIADTTGKKHSRSNSGKTGYFTAYPKKDSYFLAEEVCNRRVHGRQ